MLSTDESANELLQKMAESTKIKVRSHANNPVLLTLFCVAAKKLQRPTTPAERNKWATIVAYGTTHNLTADELVTKVQMLGGINKTAVLWKVVWSTFHRHPAPDLCHHRLLQ